MLSYTYLTHKAHAASIKLIIKFETPLLPENLTPSPNTLFSASFHPLQSTSPCLTLPHKLAEGFVVGKFPVVLLCEGVVNIFQAPLLGQLGWGLLLYWLLKRYPAIRKQYNRRHQICPASGNPGSLTFVVSSWLLSRSPSSFFFFLVFFSFLSLCFFFFFFSPDP